LRSTKTRARSSSRPPTEGGPPTCREWSTA
jgi:hypothetical protein